MIRRRFFLTTAAAVALTSISTLPAYSEPPVVGDIDISGMRGCGIFIHRYGQARRYVMASNAPREGIYILINGRRLKLMELPTRNQAIQTNQIITHQFRTQDRNTFVKLEGIWSPDVEGFLLNRGTLYVSQHQETTILEVAGVLGC